MALHRGLCHDCGWEGYWRGDPEAASTDCDVHAANEGHENFMLGTDAQGEPAPAGEEPAPSGAAAPVE